MNLKFVCPLITVENIERSKHFYQTVLGQKIKNDFGENITFEGDFAVHLGSHFSELIHNKVIRKGANNFELYFESDQIEEIMKKLKQYGVEFIHEIKEQPWKQRVIRFYDPDGHLLEIGESMEYLAYRLFKGGKTIDEISRITYLPADYIKTSIDSFNKNI